MIQFYEIRLKNLTVRYLKNFLWSIMNGQQGWKKGIDYIFGNTQARLSINASPYYVSPIQKSEPLCHHSS